VAIALIFASIFVAQSARLAWIEALVVSAAAAILLWGACTVILIYTRYWFAKRRWKRKR